MTLREEGFAEMLADKAYNSSKIRIDLNDLRKNMKKSVSYLRYFNSLPEYTDRVLDVDIHQIIVIKEFVPFLIPDSVRLNPSDKRTVDLLVRDKDVDINNPNLTEWIDVQAFFRKVFRKDLSQDTTTLDSIRVAKSFSDILPIMSVEFDKKCNVNYNGSPYVPVDINPCVRSFFKDSYFNATSSDVVKDYLASVVF
jgi:hypothetical protein